MQIDPKLLYQRQTALPEIGMEGQGRLLKGKVAVIGCGGLGGNVAVQLAASGIGELLLVDFDRVDLSNLHRQYFYKVSDAGKMKVECLSQYLKNINPQLKTFTFGKALGKNNIEQVLSAYNLVVDCTDSLAAKYLINDYCVLNDKVLVYGSLYKHDGYVATFNYLKEDQRTANLRDAFPKMPVDHIPSCSEVGTLNSIVSLVGSLQANEVIKYLTKAGDLLYNRILLYNSMKNKQFVMKLKPSHDKGKLLDIWEQEKYLDPNCEMQNPELLIDAERLETKINRNEVFLLSVVEKQELKAPFDISLHVPISSSAYRGTGESAERSSGAIHQAPYSNPH